MAEKWGWDYQQHSGGICSRGEDEDGGGEGVGVRQDAVHGPGLRLGEGHPQGLCNVPLAAQ